MRPRGTFHTPAVQSRADLLQIGSNLSPLVDAFHHCFPASVEGYILQPCGLSREVPTNGLPGHDNIRLDGCPCHGNRFERNARRRDGISAEIDRVSDARHNHEEGHRDILLPRTSSSIFELPSEVSDLILSYLSPAALDAARHTCKDWRSRILSNTWVLSSVLGVKEKRSPLDGPSSGNISHRNLLKKLNYDSDLPSTSQHPDAWRTRFRTRNLGFSIPSPFSKLARPTFVAAARTGTQNGFLAFQLQGPAQSTRKRLQSTLIIYRFDSAEIPWHAGTVHDVQGQGALRITGVTEIRHHAEWVLKIDIGGVVGLYSLTACEAFSKSDSHFSLRTLESLEKASGSSSGDLTTQGFGRPFESLPFSDQFWKILAPFPPNGGLRHVCFSGGLRKHTEPRFLAEQIKTGNIYFIMEVDASEKSPKCASCSQSSSLSNNRDGGKRYFTGTALLSRPGLNSVYRNVAVAPTVVKDGSIRAAIIWQTTNLEKQISELYIYELPEAIYYEPCKSYNENLSTSVSTTAEESSEAEILRSYRLIQGKRVTSLEQHMGGIHPSSPLYTLAFPQRTALGGLQFPHTTDNQETYPRNVQYQKCFVWGPATSEGACTQISFKVFDFSFADPQRLQSLVAYSVGTGQRRNGNVHRIALNSLHCACALHDDGFRVFLPDVTTVEASGPAAMRENAGEAASSWLEKSAIFKESLSSLNATTWSFWPGKPTAAQDSEPNTGSIAQDDPAARRAALERRQEWLRGRIIDMKKGGLSDFMIADLWNMSTWTQYGQIRKPDGWQELGKSK